MIEKRERGRKVEKEKGRETERWKRKRGKIRTCGRREGRTKKI